MKVYIPERFLERNVGGNTTYARNLSEGLQRRGVAVGLIPAGKNAVSTVLHENNFALGKRPKPSLVHFVADTGPLIPVRGPSVLTVHGVASRWIKTARTASQEAIWRWRVQRAIKSTGQLITVSQSSADDISEIFTVDPSLISVIHHGVDHAKFAQDATMSPSVAQRLPERFALYLGNVEPRKNLVALVEAFDAIGRRDDSLILVIAGRPAWNYKESMEAIGRSSNVLYLGFVSDLDRTALMQRCSLFIFPSLYEGFGFPVLEALAAGAPVLTSRRGSLSEVAGPSKILESLDSVGIADGVLSALADEVWTGEARKTGPEWAKTFSWDRSVERHLEVYKRALE